MAFYAVAEKEAVTMIKSEEVIWMGQSKEDIL